jgi:DNA-binding response OmpR family regulator
MPIMLAPFLPPRRDGTPANPSSQPRDERPVMASDFKCDVLIVEDEVIQCEEMADFLSRSGLSVQTAHDGASGVRLARLTPPRVALLDYNLPDMTGVQVAERLRALSPSIAILIASGRIEGLPEQTLRELGISVFVNKPLPLGPLRQAVLRLARSEPVNQVQQNRTGWLSTGFGGTRT